MKKKFLILSIICIIFSCIGISANASTSDALSEIYATNSALLKCGTDYNAPFIGTEGNVDTSSGATVVKEIDLSLPGKNGFNLNIYRSYSSYNTNFGYEYKDITRNPYEKSLAVPYDITVNGETRTVYVQFANESEIKEHIFFDEEALDHTLTEYYGLVYHPNNCVKTSGDYELVWNRTVPPEYISANTSSIKSRIILNDAAIVLGSGWNVNIPSLKFITDYAFDVGSVAKTRVTGFVHFEDGQRESISYVRCVDSEEKISYYEDEIVRNDNDRYTFELFEEKIEDERGFTYNAIISDYDGKKYYFLKGVATTIDAKISAIGDRYGNAIIYEQIDNGWLITDTYGREVTVTPDGITVSAGDINKTISYNFEKVVDAENDPNEYYYTFHKDKLTVTKDDGNGNAEQTVYTMQNKCIETSAPYYLRSRDIVPLLLEIQYPSNVKQEFTYEDEPEMPQYFEKYRDVLYDYNGGYFYYRASGEKLYEEEDLKRQKGYKYSGIWYVSQGVLFENYKNTQISETLPNGHTKKTTEYYDWYGRKYKEKQEFKENSRIIKTLETMFAYNNYSVSSSLDEDAKDDAAMLRSGVLTGTLTFENGVPVSSTDSNYYASTKLPLFTRQGENEKSYTYDSSFSLPLTVTTKRLNASDIKEKNTLTSDKKSIAKTQVYEGTTLKNIAQYTYNTDGTIASSTVTNDNSNIITEYSYTYNDDCSYQVTATVLNVCDADGNKTNICTTQSYDSLGRLVSETDGNGNTTQYEYDLMNRVTKQINPDGTTKQISYNIYDNSVTETDEKGNTTTKDFTPLGLEDSIYINNDSGNKLADYEYDSLGRKISETIYKAEGTEGITYEYEYDDLDRVISKTTKSGNIVYDTESTSYVTDGGEVIHRNTTYPDGYSLDVTDYKKAEVIFYNTNCALYEMIFIDHKKIIDTNPGYKGIDTYTIDLKGKSTMFIAAESMCPVYIRLLPNDAETDLIAGASQIATTTYVGDEYYKKPTMVTVTDGYGNKISESFYDGTVSDSNLLNKNIYKYDLQGNVIETHGGRTYMENLSQYTTKTEYDYANRPIKEYRADGSYITKTYDKVGNMVSSTDYMGNTTQYVYDELGRQIKAIAPFDNDLTTTALTYYDNNGNIIRTKQQSNKVGEDISYKVVNNEYDNMNRLISTKVNDGTRDIYTQYAYDEKGNITKTVNGQTSKLDLDAEIPTDATYTEYEYDRFGNVTKETDALGNSKTAHHDYYGNPKYIIDRNDVTKIWTYNPYGSATSVYSSGAKYDPYFAYNYNANNMVIAESIFGDGVYFVNQYQYDKYGYVKRKYERPTLYEHLYTNDVNGNRKKLEIKKSDNVVMTADYTYDMLDRLTNVSFDNGASSVSYTYDQNGNMLSETVNGNVTEFAYNAAGLLKNQTNQGGSSYGLTYSLDGNIVMQTDSQNGTTSYVYDQIGQLVSEATINNNITAVSKSYTYDSRGNRTSMNNGGVITNYTYDRNNKLLTESNINQSNRYTYDKNGNMITKITDRYTDSARALGEELHLNVLGDGTAQNTDNSIVVSYEYDYDGRLRTVQTDDGLSASYEYNPRGMRYKKTVNGAVTTHMWDEDNIIRESNADGTETARYYHTGLRLVGTGVLDGPQDISVIAYQYDPHGSVVSYGNTTYQYDAFGNQLTDNNSTNPFRYCGEYFDEETGFIYLRNRYYDTTNGRFITEDPAKDGLNWYVYCANNPVMFVDPLGLAGESYYIVVFAGINTNQGSFDQVTPEIARQIQEKDPTAVVNYKTIYPYDDSISGDTIDDVSQVAKNAYNLSGNSVNDMAKQVKDNYNGEDYVHFVGYSGGGVAASRTAEQLEADEWKPYISSVVRVGSPNLHINMKWWGNRTTDICLFADPISTISMPRLNGWTSGTAMASSISGLEINLLDPIDLHTSYFKYDETNTDKKGITNLSKTVSKIISCFK